MTHIAQKIINIEWFEQNNDVFISDNIFMLLYRVFSSGTQNNGDRSRILLPLQNL